MVSYPHELRVLSTEGIQSNPKSISLAVKAPVNLCLFTPLCLISQNQSFPVELKEKNLSLCLFGNPSFFREV